MNAIDFYTLDEALKKRLLEGIINKGSLVSSTGGVCGDIYIFDEGDNCFPRYVCAKMPKNINKDSGLSEIFIKELKKQLSFYHHTFVNWAFDFTEVMNIPVALFRYWGSDLDKLIQSAQISKVKILSLMLYACSGLRHCYKNGLIAHQDLKPANIFLRNVKNEFRDLPDLDIYEISMIADFGLANAFKDSNVFDGSRPYMAPEQWNKEPLSSATDIFALGVILHELITTGYHPVGVVTHKNWPNALEGNSKKYTREKPWKKWATEGSHIAETSRIDDKNILNLIQEMLKVNPMDRPSLDDVIDQLSEILRKYSSESHTQVMYLLDYFDQNAMRKPIEDSWPCLANKWNKFQSRFGSGI